MTHYKQEWREKATIDYFSHFLSLWVGFNSWYKDIYKDYEYKLSNGKAIKEKKDNHYIDIVKTEISNPSNELYNNFIKVLYNNSNESVELKANIEGLYFELNKSDSLTYFKDTKQGKISVKINFNCVNLSDKKKYFDLLAKEAIEEDAEDYQEIEEDVDDASFMVGGEVITATDEELFAGLIEFLYKVRCNVVHGSINPKDEQNHNLIKHCYYILLTMMQ
ncbi:MAG: hypothetical protein PHE89_04790 [Alphaproteobacteria bacterium]|nr:hypothetical protein [Alphaproteobacteria bacterium]